MCFFLNIVTCYGIMLKNEKENKNSKRDYYIWFIELSKFKEKLDPNDPRNLWLQFLNAKDEEDFEM